MVFRKRPLGAAACAALCAAVVGMWAMTGDIRADAPQPNAPWPQVQRDGTKAGRATVNGPAAPALLWQFGANSPVTRGPIVGNDGVVYVGTEDGRIFAVKPDGQQKWSFSSNTGTPSQPLINSANVVMFGAENGYIVGLSKDDGAEKWRIDMRSAPYGGSDTPVRGEASGATNYPYLLIGNEMGIVYELYDNGEFKGVRRATGAVRGGVAVAPDGTLAWGSLDKSLYGGNPSGGDRFRFPVDSEIYTTPTISADNVIYVGTGQGTLYAVKTDGTQVWKVGLTSGRAIRTSAALGGDGTIYLGADDGKFYAVDPKNGSVKWTYTTGNAITSSAAVGGNGLIYVGSNDNSLYVFGADGKVVSTFKTEGGIDFSSPAIGADGTLYIGSRDGRLYALKDGGGAPPAAGTANPATTATPLPTATPTFLPTDKAAPIEDAVYFVETGHNVRGPFLDYFTNQGGLAQFGYPRTEEMMEEGKTVQYFQRARFELFPQFKGTPYEVQLTLLGDRVTTSRRPFPVATPVANAGDVRFFPEVSHTARGPFLRYFNENGGLDRFGYPISEQLQEQNNDGTGHLYTVQYFQRARFEYHPESAGTPFEIQLGLLGDQVLNDRGWFRK
jgi:outer membrane protein assembly factor BamB